jgi:hypothetical protein
MTRMTAKAAALGLSMGLAIGLLAAAPSAMAHHSFAMFDFAKTLTLKGTVKEFQWTNPHVILWIETDPSGADPATSWSVELTSPGNLMRNGWTRQSLKPGDKVEVELNPLRDGKHGGGFRKATLTATGQVLTGAAPGNRPTEP